MRNTKARGVALSTREEMFSLILPMLKKYSVLAPPGPTHWPTSTRKKPDILDIFDAQVPSNLYCIPKNILDLNPDHSSVLLTVSASPTAKITPPKLFLRLQIVLSSIEQAIYLNFQLKTYDDID